MEPMIGVRGGWVMTSLKVGVACGQEVGLELDGIEKFIG